MLTLLMKPKEFSLYSESAPPHFTLYLYTETIKEILTLPLFLTHKKNKTSCQGAIVNEYLLGEGYRLSC